VKEKIELNREELINIGFSKKTKKSKQGLLNFEVGCMTVVYEDGV
jgi:hypothetical protein